LFFFLCLRLLNSLVLACDGRTAIEKQVDICHRVIKN
jgi:hypothetical protein